MQVYKDIQVYVRYDICILLSGPLFFLFEVFVRPPSKSQTVFRIEI